MIFDKNNSIQFSKELRSVIYTENIDSIQKWIIAKSVVIENKAKRGHYFKVAGFYFAFLEDVILYYLVKNQIPKGYSIYKDAAKLDNQTQEFLQSLFQAGTVDEIEENLKIIRGEFDLA